MRAGVPPIPQDQTAVSEDKVEVTLAAPQQPTKPKVAEAEIVDARVRELEAKLREAEQRARIAEAAMRLQEDEMKTAP